MYEPEAARTSTRKLDQELASRHRSPHPKVAISVLLAHPLGPGALAAELEGAGFEVLTATGPDAALAATVSRRADIALVDARFDGDGLGFCERLWAEVPAFPVMVIGPDNEGLLTRALSAGADDYLTLPLRPAEMVARVRAVLRRAPKGRSLILPAQSAIQVGDVRLDPAKHEVWVRSRRVHLPLREFDLLRALMENAGIVLARSSLISRLWGPSAPEHSSSLEVHIRRLRAKIEDDPSNPQRIKTVRGIGYRYQPKR